MVSVRFRKSNRTATLDFFKQKVGFEARPVHRAFQFHPLLRPLVNPLTYWIVRGCSKACPHSRILRKAAGTLAAGLGKPVQADAPRPPLRILRNKKIVARNLNDGETAGMIPRHAPPFGLGGLLLVLCRSSGVSQAALEKFCAAEFRVREAILLPSARSGILLALRAAGSSVESVVGPAFTCAVVHQAMQRSGLPVRLLDSEQGGFLMSADDLCKAAEGPSAVVLCETYGLRYSLPGAALGGARPPFMRIWDMAMCIPLADDLRRLETNDVAVLSFGLGKCLYAGWGGILLAQNAELAGRVRQRRDQLLAQETRAVRLRHGLEVLASVAAHNRLLYGFGRRLADWRNRRVWHAEASSSQRRRRASRSRPRCRGNGSNR